jgi:hypothetical protein
VNRSVRHHASICPTNKPFSRVARKNAHGIRSYSFSQDILPGIFLWGVLSFTVPPYRLDAPIEVREQGVIRRKQSYENWPGCLVFTPWSEIAGCKW